MSVWNERAAAVRETLAQVRAIELGEGVSPESLAGEVRLFIEGRATRGMDRLAVKRDGANVVVDLDRLIKQDVDPAGWSAAVVSLTP